MSRENKQTARLEAIEHELIQRLLLDLEKVASGHGTLYFVSREFNPHALPEHMLYPSTAELVALSGEALSLREARGLPCEGSVGSLFLNACRDLATVGDPHALGLGVARSNFLLR